MGYYQFTKEQKLNATIEQLWSFMSSPANLKTITPPAMGFEITSDELLGDIYSGMIISYKVSPLFKIKTTWVTEITQVKWQKYFVDEQRVGPYDMWHHQHFIEEIPGGVLMRDVISYVPPYGWLGRLANNLVIKKKLEQIFTYRKEVLKKKFGTYLEKSNEKR